MADRPHPLRTSRPSGLVLLLVAIVQAVLLTILLAIPLPNLGNIGGAFRRFYFLLAAIPGAIPDVPSSETLTAQLLTNLSHFENLPQRIPILLASLLIAAAAISLGRLTLVLLAIPPSPCRLPSIALNFGLGAVILANLTLVAGRVELLSPWQTRITLGLIALLGWLPFIRKAFPSAPLGNPNLDCRISSANPRKATDLNRKTRTETYVISSHGKRSNLCNARTQLARRLGHVVPLGILAFLLILMGLGSLQPTIEYDALEYHLQGPREYYENQKITFLSHNVYTSMPSAVEMNHLLGMVILDNVKCGALAGQFLIFLFAPATAILVAFTTARLATPRAGLLAGLIYFSTPWIYRLATFPFVEGPLCFYHMAIIFVLVEAWKSGSNFSLSRNHAGLLGLLAGGAMACKYPGLISAVLPFGLILTLLAIRQRTFHPVFAYVLGVVLIIGPWLIKNVLDTGNPVFPLAYDLFGGTDWSPDLAQRWANAHGPKPATFSALATSLAEVLGVSDWQSPLYVLLAPLALLRPADRRWTWLLGGLVAYIFLTWFFLTHRLDRFWLPLLPALAVLAGLGTDWFSPSRRSWNLWINALIVLTLGSNLALISTPLAGPSDWTGNLQELWREVPASADPHLMQVDQLLGPSARPLVVGQAAVFYLRHRPIYNTVFNAEQIEILTRDQSPKQILENFENLGITHVYIDWTEIERHRKPGGYGFSPYVTHDLMQRLVNSDILQPPSLLLGSSDHLLYPVSTTLGGENQTIEGLTPP